VLAPSPLLDEFGPLLAPVQRKLPPIPTLGLRGVRHGERQGVTKGQGRQSASITGAPGTQHPQPRPARARPTS
jgi:hypothetical protein